MQLVFHGEVIDGFQADEVKRQMGELLKLDDSRLQRLFSGSRNVLKRSMEPAEAHRYAARLAKIGARLHVEPSESLAATPPVPASTPPVPVRATLPVVPAAPLIASPPLAPPEDQITCPNCGEQQPKRILCRACATDMAMGIAAKLEAEHEERKAKIEARRQQREGRSGGSAASDAPSAWGLGFEGRMGRLNYVTAEVLAGNLPYLLVVFALLRPGTGSFVVAGLAWVIYILYAIRLGVLRLHDFNRSGWWMLLVLVPYVGGILCLVLMFIPGSADDNDHGGPPRAGLWRWFVLAWVVTFAVLGLTWSPVTRALDERNIAKMFGLSFSPRTVADLPSEKAIAAFQGEYTAARSHKVFAVSAGGSWGWRGGESSLDAAFHGAIANCEANRKPDSLPCEPANIDGQWIPREDD